MGSNADIQSRRVFLKRMSTGAAFLAMLPMQTMATASRDTVLPFRKNAADILLHFNENSLGMSPKALAAAQQAIRQFGNRYPDDAFDNFQLKLAQFHQVAPEQLIFGNGSTEVIQAVVTHMAQQNAAVVEPSPTFGALRFYAARLPGGVPGFIVRGRAGTLCLSDPVALRKVP